MSKTDLFVGVGEITPGSGVNSFSQSNLSSPKTIVAEGLSGFDEVPIFVENRAGDGWEQWGDKLTPKNKSITPMEERTFAVGGSVEGDGVNDVTIYTVDAS